MCEVRGAVEAGRAGVVVGWAMPRAWEDTARRAVGSVCAREGAVADGRTGRASAVLLLGLAMLQCTTRFCAAGGARRGQASKASCLSSGSRDGRMGMACLVGAVLRCLRTLLVGAHRQRHCCVAGRCDAMDAPLRSLAASTTGRRADDW